MNELAGDIISSLPEELQPILTEAHRIQNQLLDYRAQYVKDLLDLELKYEQQYNTSVFDLRKPIIQTIPQFWKTVLLNSELSHDIQERDFDSLNYLVNVRCETFKKEPLSNGDEEQNDTSKLNGFTLFFEFGEENPYFNNKELTKTFYFAMENDLEIAGRSKGCAIDWKSEDKNLTIKVRVKKQISKNGKNMRKKKITEPCDSFYNLFSGIDEGDMDDEEDVTADLIEADHEIGGMIRDDIIPNALDYYLGLMMPEEGYGDEYDEEDDEEGDE